MKCPRFVWTALITRLSALTLAPWDSRRGAECQRVLPGQLLGPAGSAAVLPWSLPRIEVLPLPASAMSQRKLQLVSALCCFVWITWAPSLRALPLWCKFETLHIAFCCPCTQLFCPSCGCWRLESSLPLPMWVTPCHQDLCWWDGVLEMIFLPFSCLLGHVGVSVHVWDFKRTDVYS